jgi:hypothetical protein
MNNRGLFDLTTNELAYIILLVLAVGLTFLVIWSKSDGAGTWSGYYSQEIVRIIDASKPGDNISLNVQKGTDIAQKNKVDISIPSNMFKFDSKNHEVCVTLSKGQATCYSYFNDVSIIHDDISYGMPENVLHFEIVSPSSAGVVSI